VFRHDDPIWKKIYPPSGFGCKCSVVPIKDDSKLEEGQKYLPDLEKSTDFQLTPLKAWEPIVNNYVDGIRKALEEMLTK